MTVFNVQVALPYMLPLFLQAFGLFLLFRTPTHGLGYSNKLYFINLCLAEWLACFFGITKRISAESFHHLMLMQYTMGLGMMYTVMMTLTLDRFFRVYLNIKFALYWPDSHSTKLVGCLWVLQMILLAAYYLMEVTANHLDTYLFIVYDFIFLVISISTYSYIFVKIKKNRRVTNSIRAEPTSTEPGVHQGGRKPKIITHSQEFLSIFILVITFQSFHATPDWIFFYRGVAGPPIAAWESSLLNIMYSASYISDFFIYTFGLKPVRQTFKRLFYKS